MIAPVIRRFVWIPWLLCVGLLVPSLAANRAHPLAAHTVVVANRDDPESVEIARAYQAFRGIPEANILLLPMTRQRDITWTQFVEEIFNPLREAFPARDLTLGSFGGAADAHGRRPVLWVSLKARYLVLCRGVPLRIKGGPEDVARDAPVFNAYLERVRQESGRPDFVFPQQFMRANGSVDAELALLAINHTPITGFLQNPLHRQLPVDERRRILRVARLDGPTKEAVLNMLEGVRTVETQGLRGRAYFDWRGLAEGSSHYLGDAWIKGAREIAADLHYDMTIDSRGERFGTADRMDAVALYMGWYTGHVDGPFRLPGVRFAPGAIAMHLHSYSAADAQRANRHWVGPLLARGAAATVGNVYEPYLHLTHHFDFLLQSLVDGHNLGDATHAALPALSWQGAVFGDPLYEPFKVPHTAMLEAARAMEDPALDGAVIAREMNRLEAAGRVDEALQLGRVALARAKGPAPALGLRLAALELEHGRRANARRWLLEQSEPVAIAPSQWGLYADLADALAELRQEDGVRSVFRPLLSSEGMPRGLEKTFLQQALELTRALRPSEAGEWQARLDAILEAERLEREQAEAEAAAKKAAEEAKKAAEPAEKPDTGG
ncbi:MAG: TIGR03790 family protein [Verrucomicrobiota bacterium]